MPAALKRDQRERYLKLNSREFSRAVAAKAGCPRVRRHALRLHIPPNVSKRPMSFLFKPWHLLLLIATGAAHGDHHRAIEYLMAENRVLKKKLGKKRILLTDDDRRVLAVKGKLLGRRLLERIATIVTPDTIMRWHRELIAEKWDHSAKRKSTGRPAVAKEIEELVLRFAKENPAWGYDRIQGALANLGHEISDATVGNLLKANGIEPAPVRNKTTTWTTFIKAHWDVLAAIDFTTVEVWTKGGLVTFYLLFVMELKTRTVHFAGCTPNPDEAWMTQVARNLTNFEDGFLNGKKYVLMDRDAKFSEAFREIIETQGTECVRLPPRSPNLNAHIERYMRSIKEECLSRMIFFGEQALRNATIEYLQHYHTERNHQGAEEQDHPTRRWRRCKRRHHRMPRAPRRAAAILLPESRLTTSGAPPSLYQFQSPPSRARMARTGRLNSAKSSLHFVCRRTFPLAPRPGTRFFQTILVGRIFWPYAPVSVRQTISESAHLIYRVRRPPVPPLQGAFELIMRHMAHFSPPRCRRPRLLPRWLPPPKVELRNGIAHSDRAGRQTPGRPLHLPSFAFGQFG